MRTNLNSNSKMTSCEAQRRSAYGWRMVWQRVVLKYKYERVAANLNVDKATVWRIVKIFNETGDVNKKVYPRKQCFRNDDSSYSTQFSWDLSS